MDPKKMFEKHYARLTREAAIKAMICGIILGGADFFAMSLVALLIEAVSWFWWVGIIAGVVLGTAFALVLYYTVFKPNVREAAKRIDESLGLEERLITMTELEGVNSYIATRQREDAKTRMKERKPKSIKFAFAKSLVVFAIIIGLLGVSMTTVAALAGEDIISLPENITGEPDIDPNNYVLIIYDVDGEGYIEGNSEQFIVAGEENTTPVYAVAGEGYVFYAWSDGYGEAERYEEAPEYDMYVFALFVPIDVSEDDEIPEGGYDLDWGDTVMPVAPPRNKPDYSDEEPDVKKPTDQQRGDYGDDANQIIDGNTAFADVYDEYYKDAMKDLLENPKYTDEEKAQLEAYFESLKTASGLDDL